MLKKNLALLTLNKIGFKKQSLISNEEGHFISINVSVLPENLNSYKLIFA